MSDVCYFIGLLSFANMYAIDACEGLCDNFRTGCAVLVIKIYSSA